MVFWWQFHGIAFHLSAFKMWLNMRLVCVSCSPDFDQNHQMEQHSSGIFSPNSTNTVWIHAIHLHFWHSNIPRLQISLNQKWQTKFVSFEIKSNCTNKMCYVSHFVLFHSPMDILYFRILTLCLVKFSLKRLDFDSVLTRYGVLL